jgi:hypothetical protein
MLIIHSLNPFSNRHHAINDFKRLTFGHKIATIVATISLTVLSLAIGSVPSFRFLVGRFKQIELKKASSSSKLTSPAVKLDGAAQNIIKKPVVTIKTIIDQEIQNTSSYQMTLAEKWLYKELEFPLEQHNPLDIRASVAEKMKINHPVDAKPAPETRKQIRQEILKYAIEARFSQLRGDTAEIASRIVWTRDNLPSIHGLLSCHKILHKETNKLFKQKKEELQASLNEVTKEHPCLREFFEKMLSSRVDQIATIVVNNYLKIIPNRIHELKSFDQEPRKQEVINQFQSYKKATIETRVNEYTLEDILHGSLFAWYSKWKSKIVIPLAQANNTVEESLGDGVCHGITLRLLKLELEQPNLSIEELTHLIKIKKKDRITQARTVAFKKLEGTDLSKSFLKSVGLNKPVIDAVSYKNQASLTPHDPSACDYPGLIKIWKTQAQLQHGVSGLTLHFNNGSAHAAYIRHDTEKNIYQFFDANIGLVQVETPDELYQAVGEIIKSYHIEVGIKSFVLTKYELSE